MPWRSIWIQPLEDSRSECPVEMPNMANLKSLLPSRASWFPMIAVFIACVALLGPLATRGRAAAGDREYNEGQKAERAGNLDEAYRQYSLAVAKDGDNSKFLIAFERTKLAAGG